MNAASMRMRVGLRVSCSNLLPRDVNSPANPVAVVKQQNSQGKFEEIGRTEKMNDTNHPVFVQEVEVDYLFENVQTLKFAVHDVDGDHTSILDDDGLGIYVTTLGQILSNKEVTAELSKQNSSATQPATITIIATEITDNNLAEINLRAEGLDKRDFLGRSALFVQVFREEDPNQWILVWKTEVTKGTRKPEWTPFQIRVQNLCNGNFNKKIKLSCMDYDSNGKHELIGECVTSLQAIVTGNGESKVELINPKKRAKKKDYRNSGRLVLTQCKIVNRYSFLDYLFGGCKITLACGVDFTGSNGDPRHSSSLHYLESANLNEYATAIKAVGNVMQYYGSDDLFPAYGFGAKVPPDNELSDDFALNFNAQNPYCAGVDGLLQAYFHAVRTVKLWGPTNVSPIIQNIANLAEAAQQKASAKNYFVLLLLTDGVVTDMKEMIDVIVRASALPVSIIVVGVGNADFSAMEFLDEDSSSLKDSQGVKASRDVVQFVPFRKFKLSSVETLSSRVLAEVPKQAVDYFTFKELPPTSAANAGFVDEHENCRL